MLLAVARGEERRYLDKLIPLQLSGSQVEIGANREGASRTPNNCLPHFIICQLSALQTFPECSSSRPISKTIKSLEIVAFQFIVSIISDVES